MITFKEDKIDTLLDQIDSDSTCYQNLLQSFSEEQLSLLAFLVSDGLKVLNKEEAALLQYLAVVIFGVVQSQYPDADPVPIDIIEEEEERNWLEIENNKLKDFKSIADHAFIDFPQEDLLAFIEDALMEDEEYELSDLGRKVIFVSAKSMIDSFQRHLG